MTEEQIKEACNYIRTHMPQKTKFETINVAIRAVTRNFSACTREELVNPDDAWLIPDAEREKFAGVKSRGVYQSLPPHVITMFEEAVLYAIEHASEYENKLSIKDLEDMKNYLINNVKKENISFGTDDLNTLPDDYNFANKK